MSRLENKIPPPLAALFIAFIIWVVASLAPTVAMSVAAKYSLVILLWLVGALFSLSGALAFRKTKTTINPLKPEATTTLVQQIRSHLKRVCKVQYLRQKLRCLGPLFNQLTPHIKLL